MKNLVFRKLKPNEIEIRINYVNEKGVSLLLYKDARCDQRILDEIVGTLNWKKSYQQIGDRLYCTVEIYNEETGQWVAKQDVGAETDAYKEKGHASDAFKRACFNFGIGRELYSSPNLFFFKNELHNHYQEKETGKWVCKDQFRVADIEYDEDRIKTVTIEASYYGNNPKTKKFPTKENPEEPGPGIKPAPQAGQPQAEPVSKPEARPDEPDNDSPNAKSGKPKTRLDYFFKNDEVILFGNLKGKKIGEVRSGEAFKSFIKWVKETNTTYDKPEIQAQYLKFKKCIG